MGLVKAPKGEYLCHYCEVMQRKLDEKAAAGGAAKAPASKRPQKREREPEDVAEARGGGRGGRGDKAAKKADKGSSGYCGPQTESEKETMRRAIIRSGALNGSIAEVQPDTKAEKRDERWFVQVVDGDVINKKDTPQLKGVVFFTEWRPRKSGDRMRIPPNAEVRAIEIASVNSIGAIHELLEGSEKRGYIPSDNHL